MGKPWKIPVTDAQRRELEELARSTHRGEADRARAIVWTLEGRISEEIGALLDIVPSRIRHWRTAFRRHGVAGLRRKRSPGRPPRLAEAVLPVIHELLALPNQGQPPWTVPRLQREIKKRTGETISESWLSVIIKKKGGTPTDDRGTRPKTSKTPKRLPKPSKG